MIWEGKVGLGLMGLGGGKIDGGGRGEQGRLHDDGYNVIAILFPFADFVMRAHAEEYLFTCKQAYAKHDGRLQYYCTTGSTLPKTTAAEIARPGSRVEVGVDAMRDVGGCAWKVHAPQR